MAKEVPGLVHFFPMFQAMQSFAVPIIADLAGKEAHVRCHDHIAYNGIHGEPDVLAGYVLLDYKMSV